MTNDQLLQLALQHHRSGDLQKAEALYRELLALNPPNADSIWSNLGTALSAQDRQQEAIEAYRRGVAINPNQPQIHNNLGTSLRHAGLREQAVASFHRSLELRPDSAETWNNFGSTLREMGRLEEAIPALQRALQLRPNYPEALCSLGRVLLTIGHPREAADACRRASELAPDFPGVYFHLGNALQDAGDLEGAMDAFRQEIARHPELAEGYMGLSNALKDQGRLDEAIDLLRGPTKGASTASYNLLMIIHYHPDYDPARIYREHEAWRKAYSTKIVARSRHSNDRTPDRRLKIGYVSPDFRGHPVGRCMLPLLSHHDHSQFEIVCYSNTPVQDAVTVELQRHCDAWHHTTPLTDEQLSQKIVDDRIDILVDLAMHTNGNRLGVFARKPAPVQMSYLGYCSTTGLKAIEYRLTDPWFDPPGADEWYFEKSIRLPHSYWGYPAPSDAPDVQPPPALRAGHVTFGCLNNFCKISQPAWELWIRLLHEVPGSNLIVHAAEGSHREHVRQRLAREGIDPARLRFVGKQSMRQYFEQYHQIDIALDPFPFNGGITTCDALWMGVPVITLAGRTAVGRAGKSILTNIGLTELIAQDADEYVRIARELCRDLPRLSDLRMHLRNCMLHSPLMDGQALARDVEAAFRQVWQEWASSAPAPPPEENQANA